jgi:hypothetical protein
MGKKSRSKNKGLKERKAVKPDDYFSYGPVEIARFGKINVFRSNFAPKQFSKMQSRLTERFPIVCQEIDDKISTIVKEVNKYPPTEILKRAYWEMAGNHLNVGSEIDIDQDAAISLRMVDYLQSIIASVPATQGDQDELTDEKWNGLRELVGALFSQLNFDYQICRNAYNRKENPDYDVEFEEYYFKAQIYWCNVRGHRYLYHEKSHFQDLLLPHSDVLNELFGITAEQLIDEISKIQHALTRGMIDVGLELKEFQRVTMDALESKIPTTEKLTEDCLPDLMAEVIKENSWEEWQHKIFGRFFGLDLFDIEKVTNLSSDLLDELSWSQGQDVEFFSEGEFRGWPLRIWPIFKRSFIKLNGHYYCFELYSLLDNLYRVLQRTVCRIKPDYRDEWNDKQKEISEQLPFKYLKILLPKAQVYQSVYYRWYPSSHSKKQWCEADGILICDDHLFVIEVKAGAFTYTSPANDFPAYIDSLKNLVFKPAEQGNRFLEYLESEEKVDLFDSEHNKIGEISNKDFEHTHICAITLDPFTELASQIQHLSVYSDIFDNSLVFLHFVEQRMRAFQSSLIKTEDELDHLGLYLKHNVYTQYVQEFNFDKPIMWHGYRSDIDHFFTEKLHDPQILCPLRQDMPARLKEIIDFLDANNVQGRRKVSSMLLDCGGTWRDNITSGIDDVLIQQQNFGKPKPLSTYGGIKISLFCWQEGILDRDEKLALEHSKAAMLITDDRERLLLEIFFDNAGSINGVDFQFIKRESIAEDELRKLEAVAETLRKRRIERAQKDHGKIGRNTPCPCGSGKKYKNCCLRKQKLK